MGNLTDQMEALAHGIHASTRDRASAVADIKAGTWRMLSAFNGERRASATRLRSELSANCRARAGHVGKMRQGFHQAHDRIRQDIQGAHLVWKNLLFAQTGGAARESSPGLFGKHGDTRRVKEHPQAEAARQRKAEEEQQTKEAGPGKSDDEKKVLDVIRDRPDGISVSRMSEVLGLPASLVGRIATELVEQGKVRKNGASRLYFPVRGSRST